MKIGDKVYRKAEYCRHPGLDYKGSVRFTFVSSVQYEIEETDGEFVELKGIPGTWVADSFYLARNAAIYGEILPSPPTPVENPKTGAGRAKVPLEECPPVACAWMALALENGGLKYGERNWRDSEVPLKTYLGAMRRHIDLVIDGEDNAKDSGLPHLAHVMAGCAVVLDAQAQGTLKDDRPTHGRASEEFERIQGLIPDLRAKWEKERAK
jgi:hypothetical protein